MLNQQIQKDLKEAMINKDALRLSVLRMLSASFKNKEIELGKKDEGLSDSDMLAVVKTEVKKRKDAAVGFRNGDREESALKEEEEMKILQKYLPAEVGDEEIEKALNIKLRAEDRQKA